MFRNSNTRVLNAKDADRASAAFMSNVYLWMMVGLTITAITAGALAMRPELIVSMMSHTFLFILLIIAQFGMVIGLTAAINRMNVATAATMYALYATLTGVTFSTIFLVYTSSSIASAFLLAAFSFAGLSVVGYTTKKDLGPIGSFCMMGLFGMIGWMILGFFFPSMMGTAAQMTFSAIGVIVFAGLTAYDTQRIKAMQFQFGTADQARKGSIYGALILYLDFINLFLNILRLVGNQRN